MPNYSATTLVKHGADLLREYVSVEEKRSDTLRNLAVIVVGIRAKTSGQDGKPDWAGRSPDYRAHITAMYEQAGVPTDSQANVQAALRYHVGNVLRDKVSTKDLQHAGLKAQSPKDRQQARQSKAGRNGSPKDMQAACDAATALLQVAGDMPPPTTDDARARVAIALLQVEHLAAELRNKVLPTAAPTVSGIRPKRAARSKVLAAAA